METVAVAFTLGVITGAGVLTGVLVARLVWAVHAAVSEIVEPPERPPFSDIAADEWVWYEPKDWDCG